MAPTGVHRWSKTFGGNLQDGGLGVAVSGSSVCVAGHFQDKVDFGGGWLYSAGGLDGFVLKLSP